MKRYAVYLLVILIAFLGFSLEAVSADEQSFEYRIQPRIQYDPIEKYGFGGYLIMSGLLGPDDFSLYADYSFSAQKINYGSIYVYNHGKNYYYSNMFSDVSYQGIFEKEAYYQKVQDFSLGVTRKDTFVDGFYFADLMLEYAEFDPQNQPADFFFDAGRSLAIYPTFVGGYGDYLGKIEATYGFKSEVSDFEYLKISGLLQKTFMLTEKDKFVVAAEVGLINGDYPVQEQFFLGSSNLNFVPNTWQKLLGSLGMDYREYYFIPHVNLDGYDDNAFYGDKMYACKCEYQRNLFTIAGEYPFALIGKFFAVFGNAWSGDIETGLSDPKPALGIGLNIAPYFDSNAYFGLNLATGLADETAFTVGLELGFELAESLFRQ